MMFIAEDLSLTFFSAKLSFEWDMILRLLHFATYLHWVIKVKIIYMVRKPKWHQEAYTRFGFLPKQKEFNNKNIEQDDSVRLT